MHVSLTWRCGADEWELILDCTSAKYAGNTGLMHKISGLHWSLAAHYLLSQNCQYSNQDVQCFFLELCPEPRLVVSLGRPITCENDAFISFCFDVRRLNGVNGGSDMKRRRLDRAVNLSKAQPLEKLKSVHGPFLPSVPLTSPIGQKECLTRATGPQSALVSTPRDDPGAPASISGTSISYPYLHTQSSHRHQAIVKNTTIITSKSTNSLRNIVTPS